MAGCYSSSASAPLHALANQFLGESTFSAKTSLFRPSSSSSASSSSTRYHHQGQGQGQGQGYHPGGLFPRQHLQQQQQQQQQHYAKHQLATNKHKTIDDNTAFEHAWSTSSSVQQDQLRHHYQADPWATQFSNTNQRPIPNQRHLQDLDLISSWDHALSTTAGQHAISSGGGGALLPGQDLSTEEFDAYYYQSPSEEALADSLWAQEMVHTEPVPSSSATLLQGANSQTEESDDDEDEFREEWNNDHFTQAYINTHQSQFRQIEEQDRLKEARLAEERERQRVTSGGPPRSSYSWMMTGVPSPSTAMDTAASAAAANSDGQSRLRVPGLDSEENLYQHSHPGNSSDFCVSEFESFNYTPTIMNSTTPNSHHYHLHQEQPAPLKPIRAEDRFLSLVKDIHFAEQTYYPPASSATVPSQDLDVDLTTLAAAAAHLSPFVTVSTNSAWAQEFATATPIDHQHQAPKKFLAAEWNWEKIFGKDPRKQLDSAATTATVAASAAAAGGATMDENERLKAVALARLQAVFKHLTLAPSSTVSPP
ncbi:hypothetical protein KI688_001731 [Linnemannia hyalina]|uniref:Uncharacterized protein n=1 Tax=Linnemannia hyalina TaxID=64524 RepID=A0A9P8BSQ8_9FUNG|nr:hypothetical protein KI688_001731 [Linnemannia hyalina]